MMSFNSKLTAALGVLRLDEAKRMVNDPNKPIATHNVMGWQILFYDTETEQRETESQRIAAIIAKTRPKIEKFLATFNSQPVEVMADSILSGMRAYKPEVYDALEGIKTKTRDADHEVRTATEDMIFYIGSFIHDLAKMRYSESSLFNLQIAAPDPSLPPLENIRATIIRTLRTVPQQLTIKLQELGQPSKRDGPAPTADDIEMIVKVISKGIVALKILNVRKLSMVPVRIHFVPDYPQSGYGDARKAADADPGNRPIKSAPDEYDLLFDKNKQDTQRVNIYVPVKDLHKAWTKSEILGSFLHEIGHILFNSSRDLQMIAQQLSKDMPAPSREGSPEYVYVGATEPHLNHTSGNEWTAEMVRAVALGDNSAGFTPKQISTFKKALARVSLSPHSGISYRLGQDEG